MYYFHRGEKPISLSARGLPTAASNYSTVCLIVCIFRCVLYPQCSNKLTNLSRIKIYVFAVKAYNKPSGFKRNVEGDISI